ncbi:MAG: 4Fe-4S binding protein [Cloacibacillus evryensis]
MIDPAKCVNCGLCA